MYFERQLTSFVEITIMSLIFEFGSDLCHGELVNGGSLFFSPFLLFEGGWINGWVQREKCWCQRIARSCFIPNDSVTKWTSQHYQRSCVHLGVNCVVLLQVFEVIRFVDHLDKGFIYIWEEFWSVHLLVIWDWLSWDDPVWLTGY